MAPNISPSCAQHIDPGAQIESPAERLAQIAAVFHARRVGKDRYMGHCTGPMHQHGDRKPALDIRLGRNDRILLKCWVGCRTKEVIEAAGLTWRDLFADGPRPTRGQLREQRRRQRIAKAKAEAERREHRELANRYRSLNEQLDAIAYQLARMPDGPEGDDLALVFHAVIDQVHEIETVYEREEAQGFHDRLVRFCERWHIDRQALLARYTADEYDERTEAA